MASANLDYDATFKILVLGDSGVGKTSLIHRFTDEVFEESYISTIGIDSRSKIIDLVDEKIRLQIWDTAGQERFRTLTSAYYRGAMGILLVYDVTSESSYDNVSNWLDNIAQNASPTVCQICIANKVDVVSERVISDVMGRRHAEEHGLTYFETSAKSGLNVEKVFMEMAKLVNCERKRKEENTGRMPAVVLAQERNAGACC